MRPEDLPMLGPAIVLLAGFMLVVLAGYIILDVRRMNAKFKAKTFSSRFKALGEALKQALDQQAPAPVKEGVCETCGEDLEDCDCPSECQVGKPSEGFTNPEGGRENPCVDAKDFVASIARPLPYYFDPDKYQVLSTATEVRKWFNEGGRDKKVAVRLPDGRFAEWFADRTDHSEDAPLHAVPIIGQMGGTWVYLDQYVRGVCTSLAQLLGVEKLPGKPSKWVCPEGFKVPTSNKELVTWYEAGGRKLWTLGASIRDLAPVLREASGAAHGLDRQPRLNLVGEDSTTWGVSNGNKVLAIEVLPSKYVEGVKALGKPGPLSPTEYEPTVQNQWPCPEGFVKVESVVHMHQLYERGATKAWVQFLDAPPEVRDIARKGNNPKGQWLACTIGKEQVKQGCTHETECFGVHGSPHDKNASWVLLAMGGLPPTAEVKKEEWVCPAGFIRVTGFLQVTLLHKAGSRRMWGRKYPEKAPELFTANDRAYVDDYLTGHGNAWYANGEANWQILAMEVPKEEEWTCPEGYVKIVNEALIRHLRANKCTKAWVKRYGCVPQHVTLDEHGVKPHHKPTIEMVGEYWRENVQYTVLAMEFPKPSDKTALQVKFQEALRNGGELRCHLLSDLDPEISGEWTGVSTYRITGMTLRGKAILHPDDNNGDDSSMQVCELYGIHVIKLPF